MDFDFDAFKSFDSEIDEYGAEDSDSDFEEVPDGRYRVELSELYLDTTKNGDPVLKWVLAVVEGDFEGRKLFKSSYFKTGKNREWLVRDLKRIGFKLDSFSEGLEEACRVLPGRRFRVSVKNSEDYDYPNIYTVTPRNIELAAWSGAGNATNNGKVKTAVSANS